MEKKRQYETPETVAAADLTDAIICASDYSSSIQDFEEETLFW